MKQLKFIQGKSPKEPMYSMKSTPASRLSNPNANSDSGQVKSSPSNRSAKVFYFFFNLALLLALMLPI